MTLYDFVLLEHRDLDTYDTVFDACITVCEPYDYGNGEEKDYYDIFNDLMMKNVEVEEKISEYSCVCKWSDFIEKNIELFRKATDDLWYHTPKDKDDLNNTGIVTCERCGAVLGNYMTGDYFKLIRIKYCDNCKGKVRREYKRFWDSQHRQAKA